MVEHRVHGRADVGPLVAAMGRWDRDGVSVSGLSAGDVGWHLREPDQALDGTVHGWWQDDLLVAAALLEQGWSARPRLAPSHVRSFDVAELVRESVESMTGEQVWCDADHGSALRQVLLRHGWEPDPDVWVALHRDLPGRAPAYRVPGGVTVHRGADDVEGRVSAQRNGFEGSTFEVASWRRMAAGPGFRPELDLVLRAYGVPAAGATAWLAPEGGTAVLEPVAVHRDHRGRGLGRAVVEVAVAACRDSGARGVSVCTPASNTAAVAAYGSAGFHVMETLQPVTRRRPGPAHQGIDAR